MHAHSANRVFGIQFAIAKPTGNTHVHVEGKREVTSGGFDHCGFEWRG
jgi:hypothetical protein